MNRELVIRTERNIHTEVFYDIVYEWEDEFCRTLGVKLFYARNGYLAGREIFASLQRRYGLNIEEVLLCGKIAFGYQMFGDSARGLIQSSHTAVCIIDFYPRKEDLEAFYATYRRTPFLFISSREVYEYLLQENPPRKIYHLPLSLPDKYRILPDTHFEKQYDLLLIGRQNTFLLNWLEQYCRTHDIIYVSRTVVDRENKRFLYYTNHGDYVCNVVTRDDYFQLIRKCKIAFYATPGLVGDRKRDLTNGFSQVTPRFLELMAGGCLLIGQYPDNADTRYYQLNDYVMNVNSYEEFEAAMNQRLQQEVNMKDYSQYLESHYTSVVARDMVRLLKSFS